MAALKLLQEHVLTDQGRQTLEALGAPAVSRGPLVELLATAPEDPKKVARILQRCPTLSGRVLSVINSAAFGLPRAIWSLDRAVNLLGPRRARSLALAYGLRLMAEQSALPGPLLDAWWASSLQKACAAQRLCELFDSGNAETAFSLALIQDIGLPSLMALDPGFYDKQRSIVSRKSCWVSRERRRFGLDHPQVGQFLLESWQGEESLWEWVRDHHRTPPTLGHDDQLSLLRLAVFFSSLMPHLDEPIDPRQREWMFAIHARFLYQDYPTPERFLDEVRQMQRNLTGQQTASTATGGDGRLIGRLAHEVTMDNTRMVANLHRLEQTLERDRQDLHDLRSEAFTDPLTKLLNRRGFTTLVGRRLKQAVKQGQGVCCMLGDMDDFKAVNDRFGHAAGDQTLRGMAKLMRRCVSQDGLIGRLGGDEFALFAVTSDPAHARSLAEAVMASIEGQWLRLEAEVEIQLHMSLGAVYTPCCSEETTVDELLRVADRAMYHRKRHGKHGLFFLTRGELMRIEPAEKNPETKFRQTPRSEPRM